MKPTNPKIYSGGPIPVREEQIAEPKKIKKTLEDEVSGGCPEYDMLIELIKQKKEEIDEMHWKNDLVMPQYQGVCSKLKEIKKYANKNKNYSFKIKEIYDLLKAEKTISLGRSDIMERISYPK